MKILAVDTATTSCSVALIQNESLLAESFCDDGKTHSINLAPMITGLLNRCKVNPTDIDGFAISIGPGSFTGLRIGVSTIKGLAYGCNKPIIGINSLDALAFPLMKHSLPIISTIDAKRGEIYYSIYNVPSNKKIICRERVYNVASPRRATLDMPKNAILVGSGVFTYLDFFKKEFKNFRFRSCYNAIKASSVAFIAAKSFKLGKIDRIETLTPYYIRKSDAQRYKTF